MFHACILLCQGKNLGVFDNGLERRLITLALWIETLPWRNDPRVFKWNKTNRPIEFNEHVQWFRERESRLDEIPIFAYFHNSVFAGTARLDLVEKNSYEVSVLVHPEMRGLGFGRLILNDLIYFFLTEKPLNAKLIAVIHIENKVSQSLFKSSGFREILTAHPFVHFEYLQKVTQEICQQNL